MKLKHLYENYDLKKSDDVKNHNIVTILFENDDCQIINFDNNKNITLAEYIEDYQEPLQIMIDDINNTSNIIAKNNKLIEMLYSSLVHKKCINLIKTLSTNYFGYSGWHIPSSKELKNIHPSAYNKLSGMLCLDQIVLDLGMIWLKNVHNTIDVLADNYTLSLIRYK